MVRDVKIKSLKKYSDDKLLERTGRLKREQRKTTTEIKELQQKRRKIKREHAKTKKVFVDR